eukprot:1156138-Pelagomonas_calceolata.AAC.8
MPKDTVHSTQGRAKRIERGKKLHEGLKGTSCPDWTDDSHEKCSTVLLLLQLVWKLDLLDTTWIMLANKVVTVT